MSNYYAMKQYIIGDNHCKEYRYVVTDWNITVDCPGVEIEYQEFEDKQWVTKNNISMGEKPFDLLVEVLNEIKNSELTKEDY
jgi:hypothetical protein